MILTHMHDVKTSSIHRIWKISGQGTSDRSSAMTMTDSRSVKLLTQIQGGKRFHVFGHLCFPIFFLAGTKTLTETLTKPKQTAVKETRNYICGETIVGLSPWHRPFGNFRKEHDKENQQNYKQQNKQAKNKT